MIRKPEDLPETLLNHLRGKAMSAAEIPCESSCAAGCALYRQFETRIESDNAKASLPDFLSSEF